MAFEKGTDSSNNTRSNNRPARGGNTAEFEKAAGFLNIYAKTRGGQAKRKVGTIALQASNETQKAIFDFLNKGGSDEERAALVTQMLQHMIFEFNPAVDNEAEENQLAFLG